MIQLGPNYLRPEENPSPQVSHHGSFFQKKKVVDTSEKDVKTLEARLSKAIQQVKDEQSEKMDEDTKYHVIFVIADSPIEASDQLTTDVVESSSLPVSIVFLGTKEEYLKEVLPFCQRKNDTRRSVISASLASAGGGGTELAKQALVRLPQQVDEYLYFKEQEDNRRDQDSLIKQESLTDN